MIDTCMHGTCGNFFKHLFVSHSLCSANALMICIPSWAAFRLLSPRADFTSTNKAWLNIWTPYHNIHVLSFVKLEVKVKICFNIIAQWLNGLLLKFYKYCRLKNVTWMSNYWAVSNSLAGLATRHWEHEIIVDSQKVAWPRTFYVSYRIKKNYQITERNKHNSMVLKSTSLMLQLPVF